MTDDPREMFDCEDDRCLCPSCVVQRAEHRELTRQLKEQQAAERWGEAYAARSGTTLAMLRSLGRDIRPCDCGQDGCEGFQMVHVEPERVAPRPEDCTHQEFRAQVTVARVLDAGRFFADITVRCDTCGEPFRFVGVPAGLDYTRPTCSIDGLELRVPIEPEIEKRLHDRASFMVPAIPEKH